MIPAPLSTLGKLRRISLSLTCADLLVAVGTAVGTHRRRRVGYVHVLTEHGEGVGEIAAMDSTVGDDADLDSVLRLLASEWIPRVFTAAHARGGVCPGSHVIMGLGPSGAADKMAIAAIEMALLDLELRVADQPLASWLNVEAQDIAFGAVIGVPENREPREVLDRAIRAIGGGAARIRLKVERGFSVVPAQIVREAVEVPVQVDANGAFMVDGTSSLEPELVALDRVGVGCLEQPIGGRDLTKMAAVREQLSTPMCLDEPVTGVLKVRDILRYGAADALCVKPGRMGGIRPALRVLEVARSNGIACFIGGMFETGLGRAMLGVLAEHPAATLISDVAAPSTYLTVDPCDLEPPSQGRQPLWRSPGVGPHPSQDALEYVIHLES